LPVDWKRIYEEFDKLPGETVDKLYDMFSKISPEKLKEYFLANPYARKVYEEKLKLKLPTVERCPIDGTPLSEVKRVPIFIKDPIRLSPEEEYWRARLGIPLPTVHVEWIDVPETMRVWMCSAEPPHYFERDATGKLVERSADYIYRKILRERAKIERLTAPPAPRPPTYIPPEMLPIEMRPPELRPVYSMGPLDYVKYVKKIDILTWAKMSEEERKAILDEYRRRVDEELRRRWEG
jgi:hypothetical protein